jgi:predicted nucleic acid-binding Zn ribbon protein
MTDTPDVSYLEDTVTPERRLDPRGCTICHAPNPPGTLTCGSPECRRELMHRQQNVSYVRRRSFQIRMYAVLLDWDINRICSSEQLDNADASGYL